MSAAIRVSSSGDHFLVHAPTGRPVRFTRHDQALDYAELLLKAQARERAAAGNTGGYQLRSRRHSDGLIYDVIDRTGQRRATLSSRDLALNKIDELVRLDGLRPRPCLSCGATFESEGSHHRLCKACNTRAMHTVLI